MNKGLLIIALFIGLGNVNAQYNATWDETVTFMEKYSHEMYTYDSSSCQSGNNEISIDGKLLTAKFKFKDGSGEMISKMDLSKLKNITLGEGFIQIELNSYYNEKSAGENAHNIKDMKIHFCDEEFIDRITKGFQHLTNLAKAKRK